MWVIADHYITFSAATKTNLIENQCALNFIYDDVYVFDSIGVLQAKDAYVVAHRLAGILCFGRLINCGFRACLFCCYTRNFWSYGTWPLLLMFLEKLIQKYRSKQEIELLEVRALPSEHIKFRPAHNKKFRYKAGQYIYIVSKKRVASIHFKFCTGRSIFILSYSMFKASRLVLSISKVAESE